MIQPAVELRQVTKAYGASSCATTALLCVSVTVPRGQFLSVMGRSGSGKSTLLGVIGGLEPPDNGTVIVDGTDLGSLRDTALANLRLRTVGYVFQEFNLLPLLTAEENVGWPLAYSGAGRATVRARVAEVLAAVGLADRAERLPTTMSGGEQQRVAVARAIVMQPQVLLADEPTGNLDSQTGRVVLELLRRLNIEQGTTIVMVTHDRVAASYGDRTIELEDGRIAWDSGISRQGGRPVRAFAREGVR